MTDFIAVKEMMDVLSKAHVYDKDLYDDLYRLFEPIIASATRESLAEQWSSDDYSEGWDDGFAEGADGNRYEFEHALHMARKMGYDEGTVRFIESQLKW